VCGAHCGGTLRKRTLHSRWATRPGVLLSSRRVSFKVVLNLCHKIGFEVAKLPPQTQWPRLSSKLSLSPAELRGAKRLGQGRAPRARRRAPALPRRARQATKPCRVGGRLWGASRLPPAVHTAICTAACACACTCCSTYCSMYCRGGTCWFPQPPPTQFFF
jgi:hypothetical protein